MAGLAIRKSSKRNQEMVEASTQMGSETLVKIRGLRFARGNRPIFDGVDLDIPRGKVCCA
jgi:ABC-type transporter Mla maintaining outer membrane lipid asymmetry ATPase subunit MlaF